ncbi:MAG TPA: hypothetical protein VHT97_08105 [Acidimicrobiales bacterium]|jgi:hypothetical protein|nr:hypothetical protein [Acidimicrobiales bacterium]
MKKHLTALLAATAALTSLGAMVMVMPAQAATPSTYVPLPPARILDTRTTLTPFAAGTSRDLTVAGAGGVPLTGATAVVLNVTATDAAGAPSFLTVYPSGTTQPTASNLNFAPGPSVANLVTATLGSNGAVTLYNNQGTVDVVVDVEGYYTATTGTGSGYVALNPARDLDTRSGTGTGGVIAPLAAGQTMNLTVTGVGGVPATGVSAVALNVTETDASGPESFLTVFPTGGTVPLASNINFAAGPSRPNLVIVPVSATGQVSIYNNLGTVDVVADVEGYYSTAAAGAVGTSYDALPPARDLDTRTGTGLGTAIIAPLAAGSTLNLTVAGVNGVPATGVTSVILNVTATGATGPESYLTVFPTGTQVPLASDVNFVAGQTVPNLVIATVGSNGQVSIYNNLGSVDVVVDVEGYFA